MKVQCKKTMLFKNGKLKGEESFTLGKTYETNDNSFSQWYFGLGDITVINNHGMDSHFSKSMFDEYFTILE